MTIDRRFLRIVAAQPYPLLFATISGAHLYGFPSPDSDYDLRGAHVLPLDAVVGLEVMQVRNSKFEVRNWESSPLIVHTTPEHVELKEICRTRLNARSSRGNEAHSDFEKGQSLLTSAATGVIAKHHSHHYFGFAETQWRLFLKGEAEEEVPTAPHPAAQQFRSLIRGRGHRSAMSLPRFRESVTRTAE